MTSSRPPKTKRNLVIRRAGSTYVMVQNSKNPTDDEWNEFLQLLADHRSELPRLRLLVWTPGGAPDAAQRKRLEQTLNGSPMLVAVISDAMKMRFIASMIHLIHRDHQLFRTAELDQAYAHLHLSQAEQRDVEHTVKELKPLVE